MRDLERLCGAWRLAIIYFGSGILGNAVSAIFIPHRAESGPSGSHFGLLAALFIELINAWPLLKRPYGAIGKLSGIVAFLFVAGFLPWVDNYAHIFGFVGGLFLSFAFLPYINFEHENGNEAMISSETSRKILIVVCMLIYLGMLTFALLVFYLIPEYDCQVSNIPFPIFTMKDQFFIRLMWKFQFQKICRILASFFQLVGRKELANLWVT